MLNTKMAFHQYSNDFAVFAMHRFLLEFQTIEGKIGKHGKITQRKNTNCVRKT